MIKTMELFVKNIILSSKNVTSFVVFTGFCHTDIEGVIRSVVYRKYICFNNRSEATAVAQLRLFNE